MIMSEKSNETLEKRFRSGLKFRGVESSDINQHPERVFPDIPNEIQERKKIMNRTRTRLARRVESRWDAPFTAPLGWVYLRANRDGFAVLGSDSCMFRVEGTDVNCNE